MRANKVRGACRAAEPSARTKGVPRSRSSLRRRHVRDVLAQCAYSARAVRWRRGVLVNMEWDLAEDDEHCDQRDDEELRAWVHGVRPKHGAARLAASKRTARRSHAVTGRPIKAQTHAMAACARGVRLRLPLRL